jgi:hypothetical protein
MGQMNQPYTIDPIGSQSVMSTSLIFRLKPDEHCARVSVIDDDGEFVENTAVFSTRVAMSQPNPHPRSERVTRTPREESHVINGGG